jgi:dienelactone hydrolase
VRAVWERAVLGATLLAVVAVATDLPAVMVLAWLGVALAAVGVVADPARWQLYPAYLAAAVPPLLIVTGPPASVRIGVAVVAVALLVLSTALVTGLNRPTLPRPDGPFGVGIVATTMTAPGPSGARRLSVRLWYPARVTDGAEEEAVGEALWSELREPTGAAGPLRPLTAYLDRVRTHSVPDAEAAPEAFPAPVVLYHHGLVSFAAENTLLMEHLASHGYVMAGVRHLDQQAELAALNAEIDASAAAPVREISQQLAGELPRSKRAELSGELYRTNAAMATVVARRTADSRHVLDQLAAVLDLIPGNPGAGRPVQVAAVGLSLGGAVSTELSKTDPRCVAVANLDGGLYGPNTDEPITVPYLMLYSELTSGGNDLAKNAATAEFAEMTVAGAKHLDFHDATIVLPLLRWLGQLGRIPPAEMTTTRNTAVRGFLDRILRPATRP